MGTEFEGVLMKMLDSGDNCTSQKPAELYVNPLS